MSRAPKQFPPPAADTRAEHVFLLELYRAGSSLPQPFECRGTTRQARRAAAKLLAWEAADRVTIAAGDLAEPLTIARGEA